MATTRDSAAHILDSALALAELARHYREKEAITEAWFDRADRALFAAAADPALGTLDARARIEHLILAWLHALGPHRRVTRQMILNKLEPGHLHVQIPALLRISRTVQWIREAAGRKATFLHRALEEAALSTIFVTTFCRWLGDDSPDSTDTRRLLGRLLDCCLLPLPRAGEGRGEGSHRGGMPDTATHVHA